MPWGEELITQLYFSTGLTNAFRNKTQDDQSWKKWYNPCSYPDNSCFFVKFQPFIILLPLFLFSSKILDKVLKPTDVNQQPKGKYSIGATLKAVTDKAQCWTTGWANSPRSSHKQNNQSEEYSHSRRLSQEQHLLHGVIHHKNPAVMYVYSPDCNCIDIVCVNTNKLSK